MESDPTLHKARRRSARKLLVAFALIAVHMYGDAKTVCIGPKEVNGHSWGEAIELFAEPRLVEAVHVDPDPFQDVWGSEVASYSLAKDQSYVGDDVRVFLQEYIFCSHGMKFNVVRLCGLLVQYDSESISDEDDWFDGQKRVLEWLRTYGDQLKVYAQQREVHRIGNRLPISDSVSIKYRLEQGGCKTAASVMVGFDPLRREGFVLVYADELSQTAGEIQDAVDTTFWFYATLTNRDTRPARTPSYSSRLRTLNAYHWPDERLGSELALSRAYERQGLHRTQAEHPLSADEYHATQAEFLRVRTGKPELFDYWDGYRRGVMERFHPSLFPSFHTEKWRGLSSELPGELQLLGQGYKDGLAEDPHPPDSHFRCRQLFVGRGVPKRPPCHAPSGK